MKPGNSLSVIQTDTGALIEASHAGTSVVVALSYRDAETLAWMLSNTLNGTIGAGWNSVGGP